MGAVGRGVRHAKEAFLATFPGPVGIGPCRAATARSGNDMVAVAWSSRTTRVPYVWARSAAPIELLLPWDLRLGLGGGLGKCRGRTLGFRRRLRHEQQEER